MADVLKLSHTQLAMLSRCGAQYEFRYIKGMKLPPTVKMLVGSGVDDAVGFDLRFKHEEKALLPVDAVKDIARDSVARRWQDGVEIEDDDLEEAGSVAAVKGAATDQAVAMAETYHVGAVAEIEPVAIQRGFLLTISPELKVEGYIDIEEKVGERVGVRDLKTTRRKPHKDAAEQSGQLTLYALAVRSLDGVWPERVTLDTVVQTQAKAVPEIVTLHSKRDTDDARHVLARLTRAAQVIHAGAFYPADPGAPASPCSWCGYRSVCPYYRRGAK